MITAARRSTGSPGADGVWPFDPIDGIASFLAGMPVYGTPIAKAVDGGSSTCRLSPPVGSGRSAMAGVLTVHHPSLEEKKTNPFVGQVAKDLPDVTLNMLRLSGGNMAARRIAEESGGDHLVRHGRCDDLEWALRHLRLPPCRRSPACFTTSTFPNCRTDERAAPCIALLRRWAHDCRGERRLEGRDFPC
ncbi:hypothetical protein [Rhodobacteraceae bacterium DSL-40]|uniref:hypothetical protein n=1 Tax=Amaricoccus sp. B4 TaxID=3368557 RepID=UPI000DAEE26F